MKNFLKIILCVIIVFNITNTCSANPLSSILSLFQRDLVLEVVYKNHKNLVQGSKVYLADNPDSQKSLIGKVTKISLLESQNSKVEIIIDKKYKKKLYETTQFVLVSNIFSQDSNAHIVAIPPSDMADEKLLKSGTSVKGLTFFEYKIDSAGKGMKKMIDSAERQNKELLKQLEEYIDTFNTEEFQKKIENLTEQITQFSKDQKETFKQDVLPRLKNMLNSIMERLEEKNNKEKSKELKKQIQEIEKIVDA